MKCKYTFQSLVIAQNLKVMVTFAGVSGIIHHLSLFFQTMTVEAHRRVVVEYIRAIMLKRISFKNAEERKEGAERMIKEAEQFRFLFKKLAAVSIFFG